MISRNDTIDTIDYFNVKISIYWPIFSAACFLYLFLFLIESIGCLIFCKYRIRQKYLFLLFSETFNTVLFFLIYISLLFDDGVLYKKNGQEGLSVRWACYSIIISIHFYQFTLLRELRKRQKYLVLLPFIICMVLILVIPPIFTSMIVRIIWCSFGYLFQWISLYFLVRKTKISKINMAYFLFLIICIHYYEVINMLGPSNFNKIPYRLNLVLLLLMDGLSSIMILLYYIIFHRMEIRAEKREIDEDNDIIISSFSNSSSSLLDGIRNEHQRYMT